MNNSTSYKELIVWQKSIELVTAIYKITDNFPQSEIYGLTSQMRRAAISIPSNIAEGSRRASKKEFRRFLLMTFGSGAELETQLEIAQRLGYASIEDQDPANLLLNEVMRMLNKITTTLKVNLHAN